MRNKLSLLALFLCLSCTSQPEEQEILPYYNSAEFTPLWLNQKTLPSDFHKVPSFRLRNQHGAEITEKDLDGKVTVVNFFFTFCPGICPKLTKNLKSVAQEFSDEPRLLLLSHSVTPDHDTVEKLRRYGKQEKITYSNWHLLTGERSLIYRLGRKVYFAEESLGEKKSEDEFLHTENFILVDKNRHLRGIYNGLNKTSVKRLMEDIRTLF